MIAMSISSRNGRGSGYRRWWLLLALAVAAGCSGQQSPQQRIDKALALAGMKGTPLYKIAGTVTVDGLPPERQKPKDRLVAVLYDPQNPDEPIERCISTLVRENGHFTFTEDGVAPGRYVLAFALLTRKGQGNFVGPDQFHNIYNDPDANAKAHPELVIDHETPGKTDYQINLEVAGVPPVSSPGRHAMTKMRG
jgi:hypothetical protein